jgi:hypothetical protein
MSFYFIDKYSYLSRENDNNEMNYDDSDDDDYYLIIYQNFNIK